MRVGTLPVRFARMTVYPAVNIVDDGGGKWMRIRAAVLFACGSGKRRTRETAAWRRWENPECGAPRSGFTMWCEGLGL